MSIFDDLKLAADALKEAHKIPQYEKILAIQEKLLEMQNKIFKLEEENKKLTEKLKKRGQVFFENNMYWTRIEDKKDGPFCTRCFDKDDILIRLKPLFNPNTFDCPDCKNVFHLNPHEQISL